MNYSIKQIAQIIEARHAELSHPDDEVSHLLTDSRSLTFARETLFFAIATPSGDGHRYVSHLHSLGVRNFVVTSRQGLPDDANYLIVDNAVSALQRLCAYHRSLYQIPVIAITGSRGKTCLKEWLYQLLSPDFCIVRSPRSYNSQIGVPLSLCDIDANTNLAIIEAGISRPGEMAALEKIIRPTVGIFTSLTSEHGENFSSPEEKAAEKARLMQHCQAVAYCADEGVIARACEQSEAERITWARHNAQAYVNVIATRAEKGHTLVTYEHRGATYRIDVPTINVAHLSNALCCLAVMLHLGIAPDTAAERIARLVPVKTRINVIEGMNGCMVISDSYTCDYNSMPGALDFMARHNNQQLSMTAILSDADDSSLHPDMAYRLIAELMEKRGVKRVIGVGNTIAQYAHLFSCPTTFFSSTQQLLKSMSAGDFEDELILVKGAQQFHFNRIVDMLEAKLHQTVMEVSLDALRSNYNFFRSLLLPDTRMVCMLKASGYGAGSLELARTLQDCGVDYIAVAAHDEGVTLRNAGITTKIMVLNPRVVNYKAMFAYHLEPEVYDIDECREIIREAQKYGISNYPVHIKLDTGMHRLGFVKEQLPELIELLASQDAISAASVFSHLCVADEPERDAYSMHQFAYFDDCCRMLQDATKHHIIKHILNTTGIVRFPEHQYDMVRLGIGLYGISTTTDGSESALMPVSSLHSVIIAIKQWETGTTIGYGQRGVLKRTSRIATIPVGYADGIDRHFGNGAISMWVNGTLCPTVGNICMDVCMIDVTDAECCVGDNVEIFGEHIPVETLAQARGTISYEILTSISSRIKRVYYRE
ncbi:MAG: bifunctional UDP-N-acetylmuramoyl-tripeptide:D-alanyl-D-alanine ligase/alanine racemase [Muribaculaceae bacterium]